ncbi:chitinase domain-containing protein 1 [Endogone sp. FLAS-F59071]|nr:chitinase domain-containing protein 1 [Endogone sp. FLAS-F59071]|eukprot:RUS16882.1 chitinase domain-containing protein 1 [Endogone sp. FLAS-F59071]
MRLSFSVAVLSLFFACIFQIISAHEPDSAHGLQSVFDKKLITTRLTAKAIIDNHDNYDTAQAHTKRFKEGVTLAYVTPWNNHGYDVVKYFKGKFDYVAPVWGEQKYELTGGHDVDKGWMDEVRGQVNGKLVGKIVPRFQFQAWSRDDLVALIQSESEWDSLIHLLTEECKKHDFNGLVLESGIPGYLNLFLGRLYKQLHAYDRELIVVIPPIREDSQQNLNEEVIRKLTTVVDYLSLMTYDYSSQKPAGGANAPIDWMEDNILDLTNDGNRHKLLLGLNMYGMDYTGRAPPEAVTGLRLLVIMRKFSTTLTWDKESEEHLLEYTDEQDATHKLWTPTLKSLEARIHLAEDYEVGLSIWEVGQGLDYFYDLF